MSTHENAVGSVAIRHEPADVPRLIVGSALARRAQQIIHRREQRERAVHARVQVRRLGIPQPPHLAPAEVPTTLDPSERKSFDELVREYAPEAYQYLADHDEFEDQDGENQ